jgi:hypothetical protein
MIHFLMMAILVEAPAATPAQVAPFPLPVHHRKPISHTVKTTYVCEDGKREFVIGYDRTGGASFRSAIRQGVSLRPPQLAAATGAISKLSAVSSIYPECSRDSDVLLVFGRLGKEHAFVQLRWTGARLELDAGPMMIN